MDGARRELRERDMEAGLGTSRERRCLHNLVEVREEVRLRPLRSISEAGAPGGGSQEGFMESSRP